MRITTLFTCALAGALFFSACKKSDSDALPTNYRIDGVQDITLPLQSSGISTAYMTLTVNATGKIQEHVTLSLEGMPSGCAGEITSPSGFPNFSTYITFRDSAANGGTYPVKLVCDGSVTGKKAYTFNLTLPQLPDCSSFLIHGYSASSVCGGGVYSEYLTPSGVRNRVLFNNFENSGISLYADVSCQSPGSSTSLSMPSQTVNGTTYSGYGYATSSYVYMSYTKYESGSTTSCTVYMY